MSLETYKARRNFKRTLEPLGRRRSRRLTPGAPLFVVQKHEASQLHYDFRLEMEGVLKSWAVPKGFPLRKGDKRLAIQVEDHPLEYSNFEGTIPAGNYGAGTVMVWDKGTYHVHGDEPFPALETGKLHLTLNGTKLKGEWTLVRIRNPNGDKTNWLLIKSGEDLPPLSKQAENSSALTHRTFEEIAAANGPQWSSNRKAKPARKTPPLHASLKERSRETRLPLDLKELPDGKPRFIEPMKCLVAERLPEGDDWRYEIKFDGVRALAIKCGSELSLLSRNEKDFTAKYESIAQAASELPLNQGVLDGEIVAVDSKGRSDFELLQSYNLIRGQKPSLFYYVFDLLNFEGKDLSRLPLYRRKEILQRLIAGAPDQIRFSGGIKAQSARVVRKMKSRGLEGLVAKRWDSPYEPGRRSSAWVKFKWSQQQEFVIGGYTPPQGAREYFGAILVGYYEGRKLIFASKVGTGFDHASLESVYAQFQKLALPTCPFANLPSPPKERDRGGLSPSEMRRCTWLEPRLVCEIRFSEWTQGGHLRQPVFLGLREDKRPLEVVRETPRKIRP